MPIFTGCFDKTKPSKYFVVETDDGKIVLLNRKCRCEAPSIAEFTMPEKNVLAKS